MVRDGALGLWREASSAWRRHNSGGNLTLDPSAYWEAIEETVRPFTVMNCGRMREQIGSWKFRVGIRRNFITTRAAWSRANSPEKGCAGFQTCLGLALKSLAWIYSLYLTLLWPRGQTRDLLRSLHTWITIWSYDTDCDYLYLMWTFCTGNNTHIMQHPLFVQYSQMGFRTYPFRLTEVKI